MAMGAATNNKLHSIHNKNFFITQQLSQMRGQEPKHHIFFVKAE
jgi:hypothetical protein